MHRRRAGQPGREDVYLTGSAAEPVPAPVRRWQAAVHAPGLYDLEIDTGTLSARVCAEQILAQLQLGAPGPMAFEQIARGGDLT